MPGQNYINHVAFVLDASGSMEMHRQTVISVFDKQIAYLAQRSKELDQETRVSVYVFDNQAKCAIYDKDVLRLPSIADHYIGGGMTALADATLLSQRDLELTPQKYGDHAFLTYVLTDGCENASSSLNRQALPKYLSALPDRWTVAVLVPDAIARHEAMKYGFSKDDIAMWDATSTEGVVEVGATIQAATDSFMRSRATGARTFKGLFVGDSAAVNQQTVAALNVKPLDPGKYVIHHIPTIPEKTEIAKYVRNETGLPYQLGSCFYELTKRERIQADKKIALVEKKTNKVYVGYEARRLLQLPDTEIRVSPGHNKDYMLFVQSNSTNRHLVANTKLLILKQ